MDIRKQLLTDVRLWILLGSMVLFLLGGKVLPPSNASTQQAQMPGPSAQQLWNYISKENPYKSWKNFPDVPQRFLHVKENPHGDWVATYLNNAAYQSMMTPSRPPFTMSYGSIIVKENYALTNENPSSQSSLTSVPVALSSLTVMYKIRGYQQVAGQEEWFWVMYACTNGQCDGTVATIGNQPWLGEPIPLSKDTFAFYKGEIVAGKPWLCVECHQRASQSDQFAYGDYLWRLKPFMSK
jgi:hypothetical protein